MAPLPRHVECPRAHQARQMLARSGCGYARVVGDLASGMKAPVHEFDTKGNPGIVSKQPGCGDNSGFTHLASHADNYGSPTEPVCNTSQNFGGHRSLWVSKRKRFARVIRAVVLEFRNHPFGG